ncbi:RcnB family protein [[Erwinia] mediterraneensis]|uniref:RcnB family protein n=1 Tax=[Erwinia] mediterraneensis TaxID=2161819 RepID=UPI00102FA270|nr:RcnB family protein [[Erwinia] mediterraneensis]
MRKSKKLLLSAGWLMGAFYLVPQAQAEGEPDGVPQPPQIEQPASQPETLPPADAAPESPPATATAPQAAPATPADHDLTTVIIDYKEHQIGDVVPPEYLTKPYEITEWKKRNLPAPEENSHWTYVSGNYLLITNDTGKILQAKSGDIFFQH